MYFVAVALVIAQSSSSIANKCEKEWPTDFEMQEYCIEKQDEGRGEIRNYVSRYNVDLDKDSASDMTTAEVILFKCFSDWEGDYEMIAYCLEKQEQSAQRLGKLPRTVSADTGASVSPEADSQVTHPPAHEMTLRAEQMFYELGYMSEEPDGVVRGNTVSAVLDYQASQGLKTTGDIDAGLVTHMERTVSR